MLTEEDKKTLKALYMEGRTAKEIAAKTGRSTSSVAQVITREKWKNERANIEEMPRMIDKRLRQEVVDKVVKNASALATARIQAHLETILKASGAAMGKLVKNLDEEMHLPPILEHQSAETAVRTLARLDDMARRAMGLPDTVAAVDVTSGGLSVHESALSVLESCKSLVSSGKADARTIDIETLKAEMLEDAKGCDK